MHRPTRKTRFQSIRVIFLYLSICAGAIPAMAQFSGAIQTTGPDGTTVNGNLYASKARVFLTGGPQNSKSSGLPDGRYYFQVTDPSGATLLSNDPAACRQLVVSNGRIAGPYDPIKQQVSPPGSPLDATGCEHASGSINASNGGVPVQVGGPFLSCGSTQDIFCNTPNPGGEYKLWLIAQSSPDCGECNTKVNPDGVSLQFDHRCAKTVNFRLVLPAVAHVIACKYNDTNGNGVLDQGELNISGWPITATVPSSSYVTLRSDAQAGTTITATTDSTGCVSFDASGIPNRTQVAVSLTEDSKTGWTQTAPVNGTYDASGNPAASGGPTTVVGALPSSTGAGGVGWHCIGECLRRLLMVA